MNANDNINVVFHKSAYRLMSRVTASLNSIVTAIANSDATPPGRVNYKVGEYALCIGIRRGRLIFQNVKV